MGNQDEQGEDRARKLHMGSTDGLNGSGYKHFGRNSGMVPRGGASILSL